jgi:transcriptional regulator with XRE-family HTH domain
MNMKKKENGKSNFGARLREAFEGASNAEIARQLDLTPAAITNYMEGRIPPAETLTKIADITGCSLHWLIIGDGPKATALMSLNGERTGDTIEDLFLKRLNLDKAHLSQIQKLSKGRPISSFVRALVCKVLDHPNEYLSGDSTQLTIHLSQPELYSLMKKIIAEILADERDKEIREP